MFVILNVASTVSKSSCCNVCHAFAQSTGRSDSVCIISAVLSVACVIETVCDSSKHCAQQRKKEASHTDKRTHRTPPEHLAVSVVRRHENPPLRPLFEPTLQLHFLSSNLPNTLCSFCSLFKCLLQTEMHNIRHNTSSPPSILPSPHPHCHCLTKCRVYPWLSLSKSTGALWKLFCRLRS